MVHGRLLIVATAVLMATLRASQAFEPNWLPGADDVKAAVAARRGKTELSKVALSMEPGTWAELKTAFPDGIGYGPVWKGGRKQGGTGGSHIAGYTDDAHWDTRTGQFVYMGFRNTSQFIAYSEETNAWRIIPLDPASDNPVFFQRIGHIYGNNALDPERSRFYYRYKDFEFKSSRYYTDDLPKGTKLKGGISYFDLLTETWTKLPPQSPGGQSLEYFSAMDGLVSLYKHHLRIFKENSQKWESIGKSPVNGYHSLFRHNPFREEVLMAGGNNSWRTVARLKKDGSVEPLRDAPCQLTIRSNFCMVDPQTGRYLIWAGTKGKPHHLYAFDSDKNEYRVIVSAKANWPFKARSTRPIMAFIPEYGVVMWVEAARKEVYLYKYDPDGDYPVIESEDEIESMD